MYDAARDVAQRDADQTRERGGSDWSMAGRSRAEPSRAEHSSAQQDVTRDARALQDKPAKLVHFPEVFTIRLRDSFLEENVKIKAGKARTSPGPEPLAACGRFPRSAISQLRSSPRELEALGSGSTARSFERTARGALQPRCARGLRAPGAPRPSSPAPTTPNLRCDHDPRLGMRLSRSEAAPVVVDGFRGAERGTSAPRGGLRAQRLGPPDPLRDVPVRGEHHQLDAGREQPKCRKQLHHGAVQRSAVIT